MRYQKLFYLALFAFLLPFRLLAWGHVGHAMVAELAMSMLSDATRVKVERVLGSMPATDAGYWMDEIRSDQQYKYTATWHFTNIEPGGTYKPAPNGDIITALTKAYTELQHPEKLSPEQVKFDVLVLFHLCGDLLQPLHVGYGSDKGGNTYQVNYNGKGTNLHSVWDSRIIENQDITLASLKDATGLKFQRIDFIYRLNEGRALLPQVYAVQGHKLDDAYMQKNKNVVITQLRAAAQLLTNCLEQSLGKATNIPVAAGSPAPAGSQKTAGSGKSPAQVAGTITPDQASAHIGEQVTVCGKVYGTRFLNNGPAFLNMGGEYPDNPFTAVIMFDKRSGFSYKPEEYLKGKTICVTGTVKNYKGKPEIVVNSDEQVRVQQK